MFLGLEKVLIKKLKTILHCKWFWLLFICFIGIYLFTYFSFNNESIYNAGDISLEMQVDDFSYNGNLLSLELKGKEGLIGYYTISTEDELEYLNDNIKYGSIVFVRGSLDMPSEATVFKGFDYRKYLKHQGIYYILSIDKVEVRRDSKSFKYIVKNMIHDRIKIIDTKGYMEAFILGNKDFIDDETYSNYQTIGVSHLFALSGMHVSFLSLVLGKVFKKFKWQKLLVLVLLFWYGFLVGFPASIGRCLVFMLLSYFNKKYCLKLSSLQVLGLDWGILLLTFPRFFYNVGFWFSFLIVGGIIISGDFIKASNRLLSSIKLSLVSFLFSIPILLYVFYSVSVGGIVYNLIYIPYVTFLVYPCCLLSFIWPLFMNIFNILIMIMEVVTNYIGNISGGYFYGSFNIYQVIFMYFILILIFKFKKKWGIGIIGLMLIILVTKPYLDSKAYVYYLDVGQGDSILIILPYREKVLLIDTGGKVSFTTDEWKMRKTTYVSDNTINLLKGLGIYKIDYLILSHGDYDHMGEATNLVSNFKVNQVIFNNGEFNSLEENLIDTLRRNDISYYQNINELSFDRCTFYFLETREYDDENDNSSVIYTSIYGYNLLFMGDAGVSKEEDIIDKYNFKNIDFFKVGHHGSDTSSSKSFINEINPKYCFISVGENNRYGHPKQSVLDTLNNCYIYRTDLKGSIEVILSKNSYDVITMLE